MFFKHNVGGDPYLVSKPFKKWVMHTHGSKLKGKQGYARKKPVSHFSLVPRHLFPSAEATTLGSFLLLPLQGGPSVGKHTNTRLLSLHLYTSRTCFSSLFHLVIHHGNSNSHLLSLHYVPGTANVNLTHIMLIRILCGRCCLQISIVKRFSKFPRFHSW